MGVYIKDMEMPMSCFKCPLRRRDGMDIVCPVAHERFSIADVNILRYRLDNCPLVPVPPCGRLVDVDALLAQHYGRFGVIDEVAREAIKNAHTIIPADYEPNMDEAMAEFAQYCEMYEPTYDPETGAM